MRILALPIALPIAFPIALLALPFASGCDFGTLDDLSQDKAVEGSSEVTLKASSFWAKYDSATDSDVKALMTDIDGVIDRTGQIPIQVKIDHLLAADLTNIQFEMKDPSLAQGMLIVTEIDCPLEKVEKLTIAANQTTIYPGLYDTYTRTYTSSSTDYLARKTPQITWRTDYQATAVGNTYKSVLSGGARFVPDANPHGGPVMLARTWLNAPAQFVSGDGDAAFSQDYQIEVYYERTPGKTTHFYALWREFRIGSLTSQSELYVGLVLGSLVDFDTRTSKVCREGAPVPVTTM